MNSKIYKVTGYVVDFRGEYDEDYIKLLIDQSSDLFTKHFQVKSADIGEWYDEHPLNYRNSDVSKCEKYFSNEETAHWEWYEHANDWNLGGYVCSNCHMKNDNLPSFSQGKLDPYMFAGSKFCPCCGKRMVKEKG